MVRIYLKRHDSSIFNFERNVKKKNVPPKIALRSSIILTDEGGLGMLAPETEAALLDVSNGFLDGVWVSNNDS